MKRLMSCILPVRWGLTLTVAAIFLPHFGGAAGADESRASLPGMADRAIVVGRVSSDPVKTLPRLQALADYLAGRLEHRGITRGGTVVASTNDDMIGLLREGKVDVVSETVLSALRFAEQADAQLMLREWKKGVASYSTVLINRRGSGIRTLEDLRGRVIAFEDPGSTSGFLVPLAMLRQSGLAAVELQRGESAPPDKVGYVFTNGEINVAAWVARGLADAGAISNLDWDDTGQVPGVLKTELEIFHTGTPILRSVLLVRSDLDPGLKQDLTEILVGIHTDPDAEQVLQEYYKVKRYDQIVGDVAADLDEIRDLYPLIADVL